MAFFGFHSYSKQIHCGYCDGAGRLSAESGSMAAVYDYMFSCDIDVILKGYYPV